MCNHSTAWEQSPFFAVISVQLWGWGTLWVATLTSGHGTGFAPICVTGEESEVYRVPSRTWDSFGVEWVSKITPIVSQGHMADWILLFLIMVYSLCTVGFAQYFNLKSLLEVAFLLPCHPPGDLCEALAYWELLTGNGSKDGYTGTRGLQTCINY